MLWKITQESYIGERLVLPGETVDLARRGVDRKTKKPIHHIPGPHWEPMDDEAKEFSEKCGHTFTGETPDMIIAMTSDLEKRMGASGTVTIDHEALGATIANGIAQGMLVLQQQRDAAVQSDRDAEVDARAKAVADRERDLAEKQAAHDKAVADFAKAQAATKGQSS